MIRPLSGDLGRELPVLRRINDIDAASEHGNGGTPGRQTSPVRRRVDPARHAGGDGHSRARKIARQPFGGGNSVRRRVARAHHAYANRGQQIHPSACEQDRGRVVDPPQQRRITRVAERDQLSAALFEQLLLSGRIFETASARDRSGQPSVQPRVFQFARRRRERSPEASGTCSSSVAERRTPRPGTRRSASQWSSSSALRVIVR